MKFWFWFSFASALVAIAAATTLSEPISLINSAVSTNFGEIYRKYKTEAIDFYKTIYENKMISKDDKTEILSSDEKFKETLETIHVRAGDDEFKTSTEDTLNASNTKKRSKRVKIRGRKRKTIKKIISSFGNILKSPFRLFSNKQINGEQTKNSSISGGSTTSKNKVNKGPEDLWVESGPISRGPNTLLDGISDAQAEIVEKYYKDLRDRGGGELYQRAKKTKLILDRDTVARYLTAAQWKEFHHGQNTSDHIITSVHWRENYHAAFIKPEEVMKQAKAKDIGDTDGFKNTGYLYVSGHDLHKRPLIIYRPAFQDNTDPDVAIRLLVYTLERAVVAARENGVDSYSLVMDCSGFSRNNLPNISTIKAAFSLLTKHYPTRVGFILILRAGSAFQFLWRIVQSMVSPSTRKKIRFSPNGRKEEQKMLLTLIDAKNLERRYGGQNDFQFDPKDYF